MIDHFFQLDPFLGKAQDYMMECYTTLGFGDGDRAHQARGVDRLGHLPLPRSAGEDSHHTLEVLSGMPLCGECFVALACHRTSQLAYPAHETTTQFTPGVARFPTDPSKPARGVEPAQVTHVAERSRAPCSAHSRQAERACAHTRRHGPALRSRGHATRSDHGRGSARDVPSSRIPTWRTLTSIANDLLIPRDSATSNCGR